MTGVTELSWVNIEVETHMRCTNTRRKTQLTRATSKEKGWTQRAENIASPFLVFLVTSKTFLVFLVRSRTFLVFLVTSVDYLTWLPCVSLYINPSIPDRRIDGLFQPPRPQDSNQTVFGSSFPIDHLR